MTNRRNFLGMAGSVALAGNGLFMPRSAFPSDTAIGPAGLPEGTRNESMLSILPGKQPLIKRTFRPPNYETPVAGLDEMFTPNEKFFVRWHLSVIPEIARKDWRLHIAGPSIGTEMTLRYDELKRLPAVEVVAVNMCAGNRRGLSDPHVAGVEWGHGAMGNARWRGARLKDVLQRARIKSGAVEVVFHGEDRGVIPQTPQFIKSLPLSKALDEHTLLAYEMNGKPLPMHNGFPVRLIVPGWAGTYWMKQITDITVLPSAYDGFWMKSAYRIPTGKFPGLVRFQSQEAFNASNTPITELVVNSLITSLQDGQPIPYGESLTVRGVAWDGGHGIAKVEVSIDGGHNWRPAGMGKEYGSYSWRQWHFPFKPTRRGQYDIAVRAISKKGETQSPVLIWNPAGYHNNVPHQVHPQVV